MLEELVPAGVTGSEGRTISMAGPKIASLDVSRALLSTSASTLAEKRKISIGISGGRISGIASGDPASGERDLLAMPALSNAHDHGRGVRTIAYGAHDEMIELWFCALNVPPAVDPYLNAAVAFCRMAMSGIGSIMHCHMTRDPANLVGELQATARAATDVGVRVALGVPMRDRHRLAYWDDEWTLSKLPPSASEAVRRQYIRKNASIEDQVDGVVRLAEQCSSELVHVHFAPAGPQWCSTELLSRVADASKATGLRVHMHCVESRAQREFADAQYPEGLFRCLDRIGLLSPRLTLAHGTWLREEEIRLLADRGVGVSLNASSNLRLRSGIAPAALMAQAGLDIAIGIDALGLDDIEDGFRELRVTHLLHAGFGFERGVSRDELLRAILKTGHRLVTGSESHGALAEGAPADVVVLDYGRMTRDTIPGVTSDLELLFARARTEYVDRLVVNGCEVVHGGSPSSVNYSDLSDELHRQTRLAGPELEKIRPAIKELREVVMAGYREGRHKQPL